MVAKLPARATTPTTTTSSNGESGFTPVRVGIGQGCGGYGCTMVYNSRSGFSDSEVAALYTRVNGALAQRGDARGQAEARQGGRRSPDAVCDREDMDVQAEAINALSQMDAATGAARWCKSVLERKDECSATLRRSAVFMLGRRGDAESAALLLIGVGEVRSESSTCAWRRSTGCRRLPGDAGVAALEEMLRTEQDERIQRAVVRALNASDNAQGPHRACAR